MIHAWRRLWQLAAGPHALALSDQAVVSGTSFLTIILVGRWTGSTQLGLFAIGMSVLASVIAAQDSLIVLPYAIQKHRAEGTPDQSAGNALALNFLLSGLAFTLIVAAAAALLLRGAESQVSTQAWALAAAAPFVLLREFGRRYGFAHLRIGATLALDAGAAALQLGLLFWLQWNGLMSAVSALCAIAIANGFAGAAWLLAGRRNFSISLAPARRALHESWSLGKWLFASVVTAQVQWYVTYWLSVIVLGAAAAGVYAACMSVVSFVNPLITGFGNILTPRAVLARHASGASGLRRQAIQDAVFIATALGSFTLLISFGGETIMRLLYPGDEYQGYGGTLAVLAAALLAQAIGTPASSGLATMERPKAIFLVGSFGALVTVGAVWALMLHYGLRGAAVGFLIGNIVGSAGRWAAFLTLVPHAEGEAEAARQVLRQFAQQPANAGLTVTRLGDGDHASVVGVRSDSGGPLWQGHDSQC